MTKTVLDVCEAEAENSEGMRVEADVANNWERDLNVQEIKTSPQEGTWHVGRGMSEEVKTIRTRWEEQGGPSVQNNYQGLTEANIGMEGVGPGARMSDLIDRSEESLRFNDLKRHGNHKSTTQDKEEVPSDFHIGLNVVKSTWRDGRRRNRQRRKVMIGRDVAEVSPQLRIKRKIHRVQRLVLVKRGKGRQGKYHVKHQQAVVMRQWRS